MSRLVAILLASGLVSGCLVDRLCFSDEECGGGQVCSDQGACEFECAVGADCAGGFVCEERRCVPETTGFVTCPAGMVAVAEAFCMDVWEASRPDATATDDGSDGSMATSRPGVLPWTEIGNEDAQRACEAAGKRLCTPEEWTWACKGTANHTYVYGDAYEPLTCNGLDTFGGGFDDAVLVPAGSLPGCVNEWGVYDLSGNAYEHVLGGDGTTVRGGSYKSTRTMQEHACDHVPRTWVPCFCSLGFRCCTDG